MYCNPDHPIQAIHGSTNANSVILVSSGLTKREHFASLIMAQMACIEWDNTSLDKTPWLEIKAGAAVMQADALIAELNKEQS